MLSVPVRIASRISDGLKQFQPIVESAKKRDINESDTVVLMTGMISEILGFDKYADITTEVAIRGTFCDLALKIDGKLRILIEAKAIGIDLKEHHIKQAVDYAANKGLEWVILSNAVKWQIYKVIFSKPINHIQVCEIDFLNLNCKNAEDVERMYLLTKEAISKSLLDDFFTQKQATSRFIIGNLLSYDPVILSIKKELRQLFPDIKVQPDEIRNVILKEVVKREILEGDDADSARKSISKMYKKKEKMQNLKTDDVEPATLETTNLNVPETN